MIVKQRGEAMQKRVEVRTGIKRVEPKVLASNASVNTLATF